MAACMRACADRVRVRPAVHAAMRVLLILALLVATGTAIGHPAAVQATPAVWTHLPISTPAPPARSQFGMAADRAGNIYVYGGRAADGTPLGDFWRLRPQRQAWEQLVNTAAPPLVEPHLAVDAAGNVFEFGGIGDPNQPNMSTDGHSYGLYEFIAAADAWSDLTPSDAEPDLNWPSGREDHGFAYDPASDAFFVFAGEGPGGGSLNDLWSYSSQSNTWRRISQAYAGGVQIDPREIYNISDDGHGDLYLFGGAYLEIQAAEEPAPLYVNDLWRFSIAAGTWSLLAGQANAYDPSMPLPRHYYAQACDAAGDFYILGGYLGDTGSPPYFSDDLYASYAQPVALASGAPAAGYTTYALDDFWHFSSLTHQWIDLQDALGDLAGAPGIPYVMVSDPADDLLVTFGGFHLAGAGRLAVSADTWTYGTNTPPADPPSTTTIAPPAPPATPPAGPGSGTETASPAPSIPLASTPGGTAVISPTLVLTPAGATGTPSSPPYAPTPAPGIAALPEPTVLGANPPASAPDPAPTGVAPSASSALTPSPRAVDTPAPVSPGLPPGFVPLPATADNPPP